MSVLLFFLTVCFLLSLYISVLPEGRLATKRLQVARSSYVIGHISMLDGYEPLRSKRRVKFLGYTSGPLQSTHKSVDGCHGNVCWLK